jgi:hypothetical protein
MHRKIIFGYIPISPLYINNIRLIRDNFTIVFTVYSTNAYVSRGRDFSLSCRLWTDSVAHPASYPMGTVVSFPGSKSA